MKHFDYKKPSRQRTAPARKRRDAGSEVTPGTKRLVGGWFASGRVFSMMVLAAALGGLMYVFTAPDFAVRTLRVEGAQSLSTNDVVRLADVRGQSIWFVNTARVIERVQTNAYIEQADAYVTLPDQLVIRVRERQPEVRWQVGGERYLVDASGRVLGVDGNTPLSNTLVIDDRSSRQLKPNDHVDKDALQLGRALALRLPKELSLQPDLISWDASTGMFITTLDRRTVVFGHGDRLENKLAILNVLLHDGTAFTYLDLRPGTPFYRNEGAAAQAPVGAEPTPEQ